MASLGGVLVRNVSVLPRRAASLAFAICSRSALDELGTLEGDWATASRSDVGAVLVFATLARSAVVAAGTLLLVCGVLAFATLARSAVAAAGILLLVCGVFLGRAFDVSEGVDEAAAEPEATGCNTACPKTPASDDRALGVRAVRLLLSDSGRGLGMVWRFWARDSGFLMVEAGREGSGSRVGVGVVVDGATAPALTVRLPGAVMDSLLDAAPAPKRLGEAQSLADCW